MLRVLLRILDEDGKPHSSLCKSWEEALRDAEAWLRGDPAIEVTMLGVYVDEEDEES